MGDLDKYIHDIKMLYEIFRETFENMLSNFTDKYVGDNHIKDITILHQIVVNTFKALSRFPIISAISNNLCSRDAVSMLMELDNPISSKSIKGGADALGNNECSSSFDNDKSLADSRNDGSLNTVIDVSSVFFATNNASSILSL